jgi:RNA polymerase sigma factor (sigma-70 family)
MQHGPRQSTAELDDSLARHPVVPLEQAVESLIADKCHSPDQLAMRKEEEMILYRRLTKLPQTHQQVLQLRFAQGLRCREIALRLNKSEGAIRMILSRALTLLRDVYTRP